MKLKSDYPIKMLCALLALPLGRDHHHQNSVISRVNRTDFGLTVVGLNLFKVT